MASSVAEQHLDAATPAPAAPTAPWRARRRGGAAVPPLAAAASAAPSRVAAVEGQLAAIPVYAVTNAASEFVLVAGGGEGEGEGGKQQLGLLCFAERDAEALLAAVRAADPRMGKSARVTTLGLDKVYKLMSERAMGDVAFRFVPDSREVSAAVRVQQDAGDDSGSFVGVPLFQAEGLSIKADGVKYLPVFFSKKDMDSAARAAFAKMPGRQISQLKVEVGSLESVVMAMEAAAEGDDWANVLFVPAGSDLMTQLLGGSK